MPVTLPRGRRAVVLVVVIVAVCAAVGGGLWVGVPGGRPAPASSSRFPQPPATFPGPDGVESHAMIMENARPGTTAWMINRPLSMIAGYADQITASSGQTVRLYVSTDAASFQVEAYRMGYYQ